MTIIVMGRSLSSKRGKEVCWIWTKDGKERPDIQICQAFWISFPKPPCCQQLEQPLKCSFQQWRDKDNRMLAHWSVFFPLGSDRIQHSHCPPPLCWQVFQPQDVPKSLDFYQELAWHFIDNSNTSVNEWRKDVGVSVSFHNAHTFVTAPHHARYFHGWRWILGEKQKSCIFSLLYNYMINFEDCLWPLM